MGFSLEKQLCLLGIILLLPALCTSQDFKPSRATYYGSPDCNGNPTGACGFGEYGRTVNDANVAGASYSVYRNGTGCGACYQVRCKFPQYCSEDGVNIVVTDYGEGHNTDFILSPRAYGRLARPGAAPELFAYGVVEVEYRRISCWYSDYDIMFKVHEHSKYPHYLAIVIIYVAGQNDITAVALYQEDCKEWRPMRRVYGAVFDAENPPKSSISLRFQLSGSAGYTWVEATNVLPCDWKAGATYDSAIQLT